MLNLYLHHTLDAKWRLLHPDLPLIRYADDILILCESGEEAAQAFDDLTGLLRPTGLRVKETKEAAIHDLANGAKIDHLGFRISKENDRLRYSLTADAWDDLAESFRLAQEAPGAPIRAVQALAGWVGARGPAYPSLDHQHAFRRIGNLARKAGFDELPGPKRVKALWQRGYARWRRLRKAARGWPS